MYQKLWNRNYTMMVAGQAMSLFANNILYFALSLYVYDLTGSSAWFGSVIALSMAPTILLMPFGGMAADRVKKRDMMVGMDLLTGAAAGLAGLMLFGANLGPSLSFSFGVSPLLTITCLLAFLAVIEAFYTPCTNASIPALQREENLVRANAIVNQIAMSANIIGPVLGGVIYSLVGLLPILWVSVLCFLSAAAMEVFIQIPHIKQKQEDGMWNTVKHDFKESYQYMVKEQPEMMKIMPAMAVLNFSVSAVITVGTMTIIRGLLAMESQYYGVSTGCIAAAGLVGGLLTAIFAHKLELKGVYKLLVCAGISLLPLAAACCLKLPALTVFAVMTLCFMAIQLFSSVFSIFAMSVVQMKTPQHLLGKVMAFITAVAICAEPLGRGAYGFAFQLLEDRIELVLLATAVITVAAGYSTKKPLERMIR